MLKPVDLMLCIHPIKLRFQSSKCWGVSHTPSNERKRNGNAQQTAILERATSPPWMAYAIRPYSFVLWGQTKMGSMNDCETMNTPVNTWTNHGWWKMIVRTVVNVENCALYIIWYKYQNVKYGWINEEIFT